MANYIKEYEVIGHRYGIEDFKSKGEHWFGGKDVHTEKQMPRFMLWAGGCGIGSATSLEMANDKLYHYILEDVSRQLRQTKFRLQECERAWDCLDAAPINLSAFKIRGKPK